MIIWLVGLSGSGKTTIGREIYKLWKPLAPNTVMVDGDDVRRILGHDSDPANYTVEGRYENARRIVEICRRLDQQGINVICCILCIFEDIMEQNRERYSDYFQVYLDAPIELLQERDPKGLYHRVVKGNEKNVVGIDIPFSPPQHSDMVISMNKETLSPVELAHLIMNKSGVVLT